MDIETARYIYWVIKQRIKSEGGMTLPKATRETDEFLNLREGSAIEAFDMVSEILLNKLK